ncbi:hypothetical protein ASD89_17575 [Caulobacter sp. Root656]|nr:hypothetical protein ASD89_17575 [Caulobacter sp. Root656]
MDKLAVQVEAAVVERAGADFEAYLNDVAGPAYTDKFRRLVSLSNAGDEDSADAYRTFQTEIMDLKDALVVFAEQRIRTALEGMEAIGKGDSIRAHLKDAITNLANGALEGGAEHLGVPDKIIV